MRKDMQNCLVSHIDLDGFGCNIIAQRYLGRDIPIYNVNYDELAETLMDIPRHVQLFITDLSIPENLKGLLEEFDRVIIIDHHISTRWALDWAKESDNRESVVSTERCATWLFYEYLANAFAYKDTLFDEWVKYIDDYDRYVLQYEESRRLNALFYISNRDRFVSDALSYSPKQMLEYNKERVDRYLQQQKEYFEKTVFFTLKAVEPRVLLFFGEKNKSYICEQVFDKDDAVGLVYGVDLHNMAVSLRSSTKHRIDCSKVASTIHPEGGGHRNASGASLNDLCGDWLRQENPNDITNPNYIFDMVLSFPVDNLPTYEEDEE